MPRSSHSTSCLNCGQLRIHNATASRFYIHVTSRAIIEDCEEVSVHSRQLPLVARSQPRCQLLFAPYNWQYSSLDQDYAVSCPNHDRTGCNWLTLSCQASGLDRSVNHWDKINDFKWLDPKAPSPHWSILPAAERSASLALGLIMTHGLCVLEKASWKRNSRWKGELGWQPRRLCAGPHG